MFYRVFDLDRAYRAAASREFHRDTGIRLATLLRQQQMVHTFGHLDVRASRPMRWPIARTPSTVTLATCYQQPTNDLVLAVMNEARKVRDVAVIDRA